MFLDELPEYNRNVLQLLRQPMEDRSVTIVRNEGTYEYPADFMLVAAMNPCPCGYYPDQAKCTCSPQEIRRYQNRASHALLDRIDMKVLVSQVPFDRLREEQPSGESSEAIQRRVVKATEIQWARFAGEGIRFNSQMTGKQIRNYCPLTPDCEEILKNAFYQMNLSARGMHRTLRVARTIADLESCGAILPRHLAEALSYRMMEAAEGGY